MRLRATMVLGVSGIAACAPADPPAGYYDGITGTDGPTIRSQLTTLTNQAIFLSYGDARTLLQDIDEDPGNPDNIILTYTGASIDSTWTAGATWNREHCWPRSLGVGSSGEDNSDLHMLRPCEPGVNSSRGNKAFGTSAGRWDPDQFGVPFRGEMARVTFYANTRYTYLSMGVIGTQSQLVDWHFDQMPDGDDRRRNDRVYSYQQNRNPYVDNPQWVWAVYGEFPSDARIDVAGSTAVDLGPFIMGGDASATIGLSKTGAAPTTYLVSASGDAESPAATGFQAGFARDAQSVSIPVSLAGGPGPVSGAITIDTTEVTSGGAGQGSADPDDVVMLTGFALAPAAASFDPDVLTQSLVLDLGSVGVGATSTFDVAVSNLAPAGVGAALDLDGAMITGSADGVSLAGLPVLGVMPGDEAALTLVVEPAAEGTIDAQVLIDVSDEDLPGATSRQVTLTVLGEAIELCPADVNLDGLVDAADFNAWVLAFNTRAPGCDVNRDGQCLPDDFNAWVAGFNAGCP